jgi:membrane protease subunit HflK
MRSFRLLLIAGVVGYLLTGMTLVRTGERAVVYRFGRALPEKPGPGLFVGLPWGLDRVQRVPVDRVQTVEVGFVADDPDGLTMPAGQLLTGDHNLVNVRVAVQYKVRPEEVEAYAAQADQVEDLLTRAAEAAMAEWVAARTVDDVLLNGKTELRKELVPRTQRRLDAYGVGVQVLDARVALIAPPDDVRSAFEGVAREQARIATQITDAARVAETNQSVAQGKVYRTEQETRAYAVKAERQAQSEADAFLLRLAQYRAAGERGPAYLMQIWLEERNALFARLQADRKIAPLDHHLGPDGLDLTIMPQK